MILGKDIIGKKVKCVSDCGEYYEEPPVGRYGTVIGFWNDEEGEIHDYTSIEVEIEDFPFTGETFQCHWFWRDFELAEKVPLIEINKKYAI